MPENYTVSDIPGVGFKYQSLEAPISQVPPTGTIAVTIGSADWGPVGIQTYISKGKTQFQEIFGNSEDNDYSLLYDWGKVAMEFHLTKSQQGFFTRVSNGNEAKAFSDVIIQATNAYVLGSGSILDGVNFRSVATPLHATPNTSFLVDQITTSGTTLSPIVTNAVAVTFTASPKAANVDSRIVGDGTTDPVLTLSQGEILTIKLDGKIYTIMISAGESIMAASYDDATIADLATDLQDKFEAAYPSFPTGTFTPFTVNAGRIRFSSLEFGNESETQIISCTLGAGAGNALFTPSTVSRGTKTSAASIVTAINTAINTAASTTGVNFAKIVNGKLMVAASEATALLGNISVVEIGTPASNSANADLFMTDTTEHHGTDPLNIGKFEAFYTGTRGNDISITIDTTGAQKICKIYYKTTPIATIFDFSELPTATNSLQRLISISAAKEYIVFEHLAGAFPIGKTFTFNLANGYSGDDNIPISKYVEAVLGYSNPDLFEFDMIAVPGVSDKEVIDTINSVCENRQDIWAPVDIPMEAVLNPSNDFAVSYANNWYNNVVGLDSKYIVTHFPFPLIKNPAGGNVIAPPTVRTIGTIAQVDASRKTKFGAIAGVNHAKITDIEGLTHYFEQSDKDTLYADDYGNNVNVISFTKADGFYLDGNKTARRKFDNGDRDPEDRISTMRIGLHIVKQLKSKVKNFFYEPGDEQSWKDYEKLIKSILKNLADNRAIQDNYSAVSDSSLNTEEVVNAQGMIAKFEYSPINVIERVKAYGKVNKQTVSVTTGV